MACSLLTSTKSLAFYLMIIGVLIAHIQQQVAAHNSEHVLFARQFGNSANSKSFLTILPQCGFHGNTTSQSRSTNSTNSNGKFRDSNSSGRQSGSMTSGIGRPVGSGGPEAPDCYQALRFFLRNATQGTSLIEMRNSTRRKSCGTCRLKLESRNSQTFTTPMEVIMYGTDNKKLGGLDALLKTCGKKGGRISIPKGSALKHDLTVDVAKASVSNRC